MGAILQSLINDNMAGEAKAESVGRMIVAHKFCRELWGVFDSELFFKQY